VREWSISRGCSRPDCNASAAGRIILDNSARAIYIDDDTTRHGGVAILCADHLATLRPAKGWTVIDLRPERPEMFEYLDEADLPVEVRAKRRAERPRRPKTAEADRQLAFDEEAAYELPPAYDEVSRRTASDSSTSSTASPATRETQRGQRSHRDAPVAADASRTPLLARAFEASRRRGELDTAAPNGVDDADTAE
jgi:hypothetical protein